MAALEWIVVALLVCASAYYSVKRLLPRRRRNAGDGCKGCPAHAAKEPPQERDPG